MNPNLIGESKKEREIALIENGGKLKDNLTVSTVFAAVRGSGEVGSGVLAVHVLWY